jgi:hypothetical protein
MFVDMILIIFAPPNKEDCFEFVLVIFIQVRVGCWSTNFGWNETFREIIRLPFCLNLGTIVLFGHYLALDSYF